MPTKKEIVDALARKTNLSKTSVTLVLDALPSVVSDALIAEGNITLPGIGKLKTATRAARTGRNPRTGEVVNTPAKVVVKFSAAKALDDHITANS